MATKKTTEAPTEQPATEPPKIVSSEGRCPHANVKRLVDKDGKPTIDAEAFANHVCLDCGARIWRG